MPNKSFTVPAYSASKSQQQTSIYSFSCLNTSAIYISISFILSIKKPCMLIKRRNLQNWPHNTTPHPRPLHEYSKYSNKQLILFEIVKQKVVLQLKILNHTVGSSSESPWTGLLS